MRNKFIVAFWATHLQDVGVIPRFMKIVLILFFLSYVCFGKDINVLSDRIGLVKKLSSNVKLRDQSNIQLSVRLALVSEGNAPFVEVGLYNPTNTTVCLFRYKQDNLLEDIYLEYQAKDKTWKRLKNVLPAYGAGRKLTTLNLLLIIRPSFTVSFRAPLSRFQLPEDSISDTEYKIRCVLAGNYSDEGLIDAPIIMHINREEFQLARHDEFVYGKLMPAVSNEIIVKRWVPDKVPPGFKRGVS